MSYIYGSWYEHQHGNQKKFKEDFMAYGFSKQVDLSYDQAIEKVTDELKKEGFGVLTTIDVKDTLKKKIDVDFKKYIILGACNPSFAHRALTAEQEIGLLLPCNVIVYDNDGKTTVSVFDPSFMNQVTDNKEVHSVAGQVREKLQRVLEKV
jgi:uncharacterized protein (DUF302 family)